MKPIPLVFLCLFASFLCAPVLQADDRAVFRFQGSNASETIEGVLVLNRSTTRTGITTGYTFESPVEALHYAVSDASGVLARFTFNPDNPNSVVVTAGADGSRAFRLVVEPVPSDPPFPGTLAFLMEFSFAGEAPWGDFLPDRTIVGARETRLGAADLYDQSVSIVELTRELAAVEEELRRLETGFAAAFKNPGFTLPGSTPSDRITALVMAIERLSAGQRKQLHNDLDAAP